MVIVCEGCGARFRMNFALFQDAKGARIRCRKCGGHIDVRQPEASPVPPVSASIEAETEIEPVAEVESGPASVAEAAPEQDFSREEHATEIATLKRRLRASRRRGPSMLTIFLLVVSAILLLAGGAYFFRDTNPARELLRTFFPPSGSGDTARTVTTASAVGKPAYDVRDMNSFHVKTFIGGNLFVIQGTVANVGKGPSRGIRVQATLLGRDNQALVDSTVFAANLVDNTTLRHANRTLIEGLLGVRYGDRNANWDIPAGASLPFMVVFFDPPGQIGYFAVKALDAE